MCCSEITCSSPSHQLPLRDNLQHGRNGCKRGGRLALSCAGKCSRTWLSTTWAAGMSQPLPLHSLPRTPSYGQHQTEDDEETTPHLTRPLCDTALGGNLLSWVHIQKRRRVCTCSTSHIPGGFPEWPQFPRWLDSQSTLIFPVTETEEQGLELNLLPRDDTSGEGQGWSWGPRLQDGAFPPHNPTLLLAALTPAHPAGKHTTRVSTTVGPEVKCETRASSPLGAACREWEQKWCLWAGGQDPVQADISRHTGKQWGTSWVLFICGLDCFFLSVWKKVHAIYRTRKRYFLI